MTRVRDHATTASMPAILRTLILTLTCLVAMSAPGVADQWDDLAQKFVDQEHASLVRRAEDKDGIVIELAQSLISEKVALVVQEGKPAISFQFNSAALPGDDAFELMARGGSLVTGKDTAAVMRGLRQARGDAGKRDSGVALVAADGVFVTCVAPREENTLSFLVATY
jgi:hypothetical protein